ncbi:MAG: DUF1800 domain-containing protein [Sphingomicrobium sp.]
MSIGSPISRAAIALNRFGLGARPGDPLRGDEQSWLRAQLTRFEARTPGYSALPTSAEMVVEYAEQRQMLRQLKAENDTDQSKRRGARQGLRDLYRAGVNARVEAALTTPAPFVERLVHFWANHFAVSADKAVVGPLAGAFEAEAIRPHVLGRFSDMLLTVERHPAMLLYLDQAQSIGPNSAAATRLAAMNAPRKRGLNENLAREIMELHTLGVRSGYSQSDVTEFARALTGWSIGGAGPMARRFGGQPGTFQFVPQLHEPGARTILGKNYAGQGEAQAAAVLNDLAAAPATMTHIATKLARHFAGDTPPPALVERLATAFRSSGGDLPTLYKVLIDSPEAWVPGPVKFKSPWEWAISAMRATGRSSLNGIQAAPVLTQLGQPTWTPGSPAGFDDNAATWAAPDALVRRVEMAQRFANQAGDTLDPRTLGEKILPGSLGPSTSTQVARSESLQTGLALLLVSPEFQRR